MFSLYFVYQRCNICVAPSTCQLAAIGINNTQI